jgi:transposase InsO family protein
MRCDNSGELQKACKMLRICRDCSQPGVPQTNALAERIVQDITNGSSAALLQAGLPPCYWPFAVQPYCVLDNTNHESGESRVLDSARMETNSQEKDFH